MQSPNRGCRFPSFGQPGLDLNWHLKPLKERGSQRGYSRTHTAKAPHSPSTARWAWGSRWHDTPACHPPQEPGSDSWVHLASRGQLEDKEDVEHYQIPGPGRQAGGLEYWPQHFVSTYSLSKDNVAERPAWPHRQGPGNFQFIGRKFAHQTPQIALHKHGC